MKTSDALQVASKEATEDRQLMVSLSSEEHALTPWQQFLTTVTDVTGVFFFLALAALGLRWLVVQLSRRSPQSARNVSRSFAYSEAR